MFSQFALHERLLKAVAELKFVEPTPVQAAAIPLALEGRDLRVTAQTGSGKTAAFVLPILHRLIGPAKVRVSIKTLILLPTRELAQQTLKEVERFSQFTFIKSGLITGGEDFKVQAAMLRKVPDILIGTPGRMIEQLNAGNLDLKEVEVLVLDEADRMLDMGFIDDIEKIVEATPEGRQTMLFSATLDGVVGNMARRITKNPLVIQIAGSSNKHENITQRVHFVDDLSHKNRLLDHLLRDETLDQAVVFTATKRDADTIADRLNIAGFSAAALHGDMHQGARNRTLDGMRRGQVKVLVATDVAARGIDVPTITHVFNYDLPKFPEDYVHRIGRTGRAGRNGLAISLVNHAEGMNVKRIERFTKQLIPVNVIEGFEPKKTASAPRSSARPGGWKPGDNRGGAKPAQRTFSKPGAPRKDGAPSTGGGYKGSNPRSTDGARRSYGDR